MSGILYKLSALVDPIRHRTIPQSIIFPGKVSSVVPSVPTVPTVKEQVSTVPTVKEQVSTVPTVKEQVSRNAPENTSRASRNNSSIPGKSLNNKTMTETSMEETSSAKNEKHRRLSLLDAQDSVHNVLRRAINDNRTKDMEDMNFVSSVLNSCIFKDFSVENYIEYSNNKRTIDDFNNKRIYSNSVFTTINQAPVSNETFLQVVSVHQGSFIRGNVLHNAFQILLRIRDFWMLNDLVIEQQDYDMRHIFQRRETGHPNKDKAHTCSKLYVDNPPLDVNDIISLDVSLLENLIRFFYHFSSNYAYFVMENEDETRIENTLSKSVRISRLKDLKKELPKRTDYIKANKMDNVIAYENQHLNGKGKQNNVALTRKHIVSEGSKRYLSIYQDKDLLTLPFIRKIYQWMLEKYIYCLDIPVEIDDLYVTIHNVNYPIIKENKKSAGDGRRMNYRTIVKHILSLLGLYDALESEINMEGFDFFDMLGIQTKVDGRKNNGKRKRDDSEDDTTSNKRARRDDDNDSDDEESDDDDYESMENDLDN